MAVEALQTEPAVNQAPTSQPTPDPSALASVPSANTPAGGPQTGTQVAPQQVSTPGASPTPHDIAAAALGQAPANRAGQQPFSQPSLPPEVQRQLDEYRRVQQQLPQLQQYAQLGYRTWQAEQQAQRRQQQEQAQKPWFDAPEFDRSLLEMIEKDPATGEFRARPGAPPDAVSKYLAFQRGFSQFQLDLYQSPEKLLADPFRRIATEAAREMIEERFGGYEEKVQANQILDQNRSWMVEQGQDGRPRLTQAGQLYQQHLQDAVRSGVRGAEAQHRIAVGMTKLDYLLAQYQAQNQQAGQGAVSDQQKTQFVQQAAAGQAFAGPATAPQPSAGLGNGGSAAGPNGSQWSLGDMLRQRFKENGITDETLMHGAAR